MLTAAAQQSALLLLTSRLPEAIARDLRACQFATKGTTSVAKENSAQRGHAPVKGIDDSSASLVCSSQSQAGLCSGLSYLLLVFFEIYLSRQRGKRLRGKGGAAKCTEVWGRILLRIFELMYEMSLQSRPKLGV